MARLDDDTLIMRCICGEVFMSHLPRRDGKPHIYFQNGYWRVTLTPKRATQKTYRSFQLANSFAGRLNNKSRGVTNESN